MSKIKVELTFPPELKNKPVFYNIGKDYSVVPNILEASFSTDMGWALVTLEGDKEELDRLFDYLRAMRVDIKLIDRDLK
jgi:hypothetical protein